MKILRCLIHNEIVKLPLDYDINDKKIKKRIKIISNVQNSLNKHKILNYISQHLSKTNEKIVNEALALMVNMLYMGNRNVQISLEEYFLGSNEETFFFAIKDFLHHAAISMKEKRLLITQHQQKISKAIDDAMRFQSALLTSKESKLESRHQFKRLASSLKNGKIEFNMQKQSTRNPSAVLKNRLKSTQLGSSKTEGHTVNGSKLSLVSDSNNIIKMYDQKSTKNKVFPVESITSVAATVDIYSLNEVNRIINMAVDSEKFLNVSNNDYGIELVFKILGLMCDGHNKILQHGTQIRAYNFKDIERGINPSILNQEKTASGYLREQPDNIKSVNLIIATSQFMNMLYSNINSYTITITINLVNTLIEFTSGNYQNQICVFDSKICDHINFILRSEFGNVINEEKYIKLMDAIATLIVSIVENYRSHASNRDKSKCCVDVLECLDVKTIIKKAVKFYENTIPILTKRNYPESLATCALNVGFKYFFIYTRMEELQNLGIIPVKESSSLSLETSFALDYYKSKTKSIEILVNDELERVHFKCNERSILREDIMNKFNYDVDRTSSSSKLRDLVLWSVDIMEDINYTKKIQKIPIIRHCLKYDYGINISMILLSFFYSILIIASWNQPYIDGKPNYN
ncbi:hypothetical protein A3Q56_07269, partial [Intoshia linei]